MHKLFYKIFYYIDTFNKEHIERLNKNIHLIYRNYNELEKKNELKDLRKITKKRGIKVYLAQNYKLAMQLGFDGIYLPSFNHSKILKNNIKKKFLILGSAHNANEIKIKEKQFVEYLFISPLFDTKQKKGLDIIKFNKLSKLTKTKIIALGGINKNNLNKLKLLKIYGFGSINFIKDKYGY